MPLLRPKYPIKPTDLTSVKRNANTSAPENMPENKIANRRDVLDFKKPAIPFVDKKLANRYKARIPISQNFMGLSGSTVFVV